MSTDCPLVRSKRSRRRWLAALGVVATAALAVAVSNLVVIRSTGQRVYADVQQVPVNDVGLVLGTRPDSQFLRLRVGAAAELFRQGRVRHLLLSGDHGRRGYDELGAMRDALLRSGVPATAITCDYAGYRTLDSMVRAKQVFGLQRVTVITQQYHCYRALYLAQQQGLDAVAVAAADPAWQYQIRALLRESLARPWALLDVHLWGRSAEVLGPPEPIVLSPAAPATAP